MIPVLGVPHLANPELLHAMLGSIDVPVDTTVVVDNSATAELRGLDRPATRVLSMHHNMGVGASWNLIIKNTPNAPWWAIVNSDIRFAPGDLAKLAEAMTEDAGIVLAHGFAAFGISRRAVGEVGWFDENFVPAYCEDNDYAYRCRLAGVEVRAIETASYHMKSATLYHSPDRRRENERTYPLNVAYYEAKWGGTMGEERYTTPFDRGHGPNDWQLSIERLDWMTWRER